MIRYVFNGILFICNIIKEYLMDGRRAGLRSNRTTINLFDVSCLRFIARAVMYSNEIVYKTFIQQ